MIFIGIKMFPSTPAVTSYQGQDWHSIYQNARLIEF
jgi:hypothetical protein